MSRTEIDSDQVLDDSLTSQDIKDGEIKRQDIDILTVGQSLIRKVLVGIGLRISSSTGADAGTGDVTIVNKSGNYGQDYARKTRTTAGGTNISGGSFQEYDSLTFTVTDNEPNEFHVLCDFIWGHNSASNDIRGRLLLDGSQVGLEYRVEPKDPNTDQRKRGRIEFDVTNLSQGTHTLSIEFRPSSASRVSRLYETRLQAMRTI